MFIGNDEKSHPVKRDGFFRSQELIEMIRNSNFGFTLIELMIVVAVIGILAAIAIPNFLGMQEKAKRRALQEGVSSAKSELHSWMDSAAKAERGVVDVNGDGIIEMDELHSNLQTVPNSWVQALAKKSGSTPMSPWNPKKELYVIGPLLPANTGQIALSLLNNYRTLQIYGLSINGIELIQDSVSIE